MYQDSQDTIVALSTPSGSSLCAIIRISGTDALFCAERLFIPTAGWHGQTRLSVLNGETQRSAIRNMQPRTYLFFKGNVHLPHEQIEIPSTLYIMKAPYSYTKEDVVEIHTFGSPPILDMIVEALISLKQTSKSCIRLAQPGEFTKRAFLHGRIDLTQAEAVMGLIRSRTDADLRAALSHLKGNTSKKVKEIQLDLIECCAEIEASIDFSDQDIEFAPVSEITERLNIIYEKLNGFLNHNATTSVVHSDGVKTVLCGRPNAGKSSLFNALLGRRQAIVTPIPGTTRDVLEGVLELGNVHFRLLDTAGILQFELRTLNSELRTPQSLAIAKAYNSLQMGQLILFVLDGSKAVEDEDIELFNSFPSLQKIIVINKCDIVGAYCNTPLPEDFKGHPIVKTSTVTGKGLGDLKNAMVRTIHDGRIDQSASAVTLNARHKAAFKRTLELIECAKEAAAQAR
ncbi:MAG: tRNA modification GTPase, partial [Planctomycetes bacterium]|nr:tRNA modification GTPase [Planctomycetota bacterium]